MEKVVNEINQKEKKIKTVIIDLFSISGEEEFLEVFAREVIKAFSSKWEDWVQSAKDFFKHLIPEISMGIDPYHDFSLSFDWEKIKKYKDEILNLPASIAIREKMNL